MEPGEDDAADVRIDGLPTEDAAATVVALGDAEEFESARATLQEVTEDGVVTWDAVDDALAHLAKVVSTPETRLELAEKALEEARGSAAPVSDLDAVESRLGGFEARLDAIESRVDALGADLQALVGGSDDGLYETAREIRRVREEANTLQQAADERQMDLESFEAWLANPAVRFDELEADVEAVEETLARLEETADALQPERSDSLLRSGSPEIGDPGTRWASATADHRVTGLLLEDVRAEFADLRTWADRDGEAVEDRTSAITDRLEELEARHDSIGEELASIDAPVWHARFDERIAAVEETLEAFEPPIDWAALQAALDDVGAVTEESV